MSAARPFEDSFDRVLGINLKGVFLCCQAVIPCMTSRGKGRIVNIGSTAAPRMTFSARRLHDLQARRGGLTQPPRLGLADHHITVNMVCPGGVLTR